MNTNVQADKLILSLLECYSSSNPADCEKLCKVDEDILQSASEKVGIKSSQCKDIINSEKFKKTLKVWMMKSSSKPFTFTEPSYDSSKYEQTSKKAKKSPVESKEEAKPEEAKEQSKEESKEQSKEEQRKDGCVKVPISSSATKKLASDIQNMMSISKSYFIDNIKLVDYFYNHQLLPNCQTAYGASGEQYSMEMTKLKNILTRCFSSTNIFSPTKDYQDQVYLECFVRDVLDCVRDSRFDNSEKVQIITEDMKKWFSFTKLNTKSKFGSVYKTYLREDKSKPFAITKLAQQFGSKGSAENYHELAIGYVLNQLRREIPYFSYTYGGFLCDGKQSRDDLTCNPNSTGNQITTVTMQECVPVIEGTYIYELINSSKKVSAKKLKQIFLDVMIQVAHALATAQKACKFMHYDLHAQNVVIRKTSPKNIKCKGDGYDVELKDVEYVPVIIDYGKSALTYRAGSKDIFVSPGDVDDKPKVLEELANDPKGYFLPAYDIYRFFLDTFDDMADRIEKNDEVRSEFRECLLAFMKPYQERESYAKSPKLKKFLKADTMTDLLTLYFDTDGDIVTFINVKDKDVMNFPISKVINALAKVY